MKTFTRPLRMFAALSITMGLVLINTAALSSSLPRMELYLNEDCNCCTLWAEHVREAGFTVEVHHLGKDELTAFKEEHHVGADSELSSCHTALVDGYVIEGHVPAKDIKALLSEQPDIKGLVVPGMPLGSPGMDFGDEKDDYEVLAFDESGDTYTFASYEY